MFGYWRSSEQVKLNSILIYSIEQSPIPNYEAPATSRYANLTLVVK